ncbi:chorismate--pyruvate lyase family protein [Paludibacterium yongneupense]|uniref:chorismate--pyruvate lyase family protein n=1 Tax=Paludibacterium yongneupense TaxID=400061 RepID=UPI0004009ED1|nr:chorismate lyase [Paludibacterium yongneupense]
MIIDSYWQTTPPAAPPKVLGCLTEPGSLTERLRASGHRFAVELQALGSVVPHPDECGLFGDGKRLWARQVTLTLDDVPVVIARSLCREDCPQWLPILDRGARSLGLTLFGEGRPIVRQRLHYTMLTPAHPWHARAAALGVADAVPARRCGFELAGRPLYVCEAFLPALETFL